MERSPDGDDDEYEFPAELFAGIVITIMGILVLATMATTGMPTDHVVSPYLMNTLSGMFYLAIGGYFIHRGRA